MVGDSEMAAFRAVLERNGRMEAEFVVTGSDSLDLGGGMAVPGMGSVVVRNRRTHVTRTYMSGMGASWVDTFEADLASGLFK